MRRSRIWASALGLAILSLGCRNSIQAVKDLPAPEDLAFSVIWLDLHRPEAARGAVRRPGEGGTGKSTLASQFARWALAAEPASRLAVRSKLPIHVARSWMPSAPSAATTSPGPGRPAGQRGWGRAAVRGKMAGLMSPQNKTLALFAVVAYVVSVPLSAALVGTAAKAWLLLVALVPCAIALVWVKILFLRPRLQTVPAFLRGGVLALLSYLSFGVVGAVGLSLTSNAMVAGLRETLWYFLIVGTVMFGLPLVVVGAVTGFVADKLFSNPSR